MRSTDDDACDTPARYALGIYNRKTASMAGCGSALQGADRDAQEKVAGVEKTDVAADSTAASKVYARHLGPELLVSCSESRAGLQVPSERSRSRVLHPTRRRGSQVLYQLEQT